MTDKEPVYRVGIDVGGTFTDFVLVDEARDLVFTGKQLTTSSDPGIAICEGVERVAREAGLELADIDGIVHGTTLVANTIVERTGARVGFITTRGFRDVLEVGTEMRYDLYDLFMEKAEPLAPRDRRLTVDERIDSGGTVLLPMDEAELREAVRALVGMGVEAVAVCFVNSYVNPVHERLAREILAESFPALPLTVSTAVAPEIREYERACTAAANAYVMPLMRRYVTGLHGRLGDLGLRAPLNVMLSGGGIAALRVARETPIHLIESGPAAGAIAGAHYAGITDSPCVIAFDMGGTTAKMCLIENGEPEHATTFEAGRVRRFAHGSGIPLKVPVIDLIEIGAGGGSIARLDAMGLMKVGPQSAGAEPGPVCYGRGGTEPTVTDADLWLGYLSPDFFLGGEMPLEAAAVKAAMDAALSAPAGLDTTGAAAGVHAIVNNNMAAAARRHIAEKGRDPRRYSLVATGGAGPVHAWGLARLLGIRRIICPLGAGVTSSLGFLIAAPATDLAHSHVCRVESVPADVVNAFYDAMARDATAALVEAGGDAATIAIERRVDMRYVGQGFEIEVPVPDGVLGPGLGAELHDRFLDRYDELFGRRIAGVPAETVTWRLSASGPTPNVTLNFEGQRFDAGAAEKGERPVHFPETGFTPCTVYNRYGLGAGTVFRGPAVIEERESTVVAGPDTTVSIDRYLNLIIDLDEPRPG
ncbi:MAG: hydantoinase/oxoprolinase family protein [Alphaproteobacteria bacterium]|nr:hydantoinase/oxoprolinase family protein [Alphaproteobacteria bacterium]